jgi:hypothetical protein
MTNRNPSKEGPLPMSVSAPTNGSAVKLNDAVSHPAHYTQGSVECIDAIKAAMTPDEYRGFLKGQVIKYVWRCDRKHTSPLTDLRKAAWYLERLIQSVTE